MQLGLKINVVVFLPLDLQAVATKVGTVTFFRRILPWGQFPTLNTHLKPDLPRGLQIFCESQDLHCGKAEVSGIHLQVCHERRCSQITQGHLYGWGVGLRQWSDSFKALPGVQSEQPIGWRPYAVGLLHLLLQQSFLGALFALPFCPLSMSPQHPK